MGRCGSLRVVVGRCGSLRDRCGIVVGRCGSLWVVVGRCGSLWVVVDRCGSLWLVVGGCGSFRVLVTTHHWQTDKVGETTGYPLKHKRTRRSKIVSRASGMGIEHLLCATIPKIAFVIYMYTC